MITFRQLRHLFLSFCTVLLLTNIFSFNFILKTIGTANASAPLVIHQAQPRSGEMNPIEAVAKNIEGKTQETMGKITGNGKDKRMGKAKQVESKNRNLEQAKNQARSGAEETSK